MSDYHVASMALEDGRYRELGTVHQSVRITVSKLQVTILDRHGEVTITVDPEPGPGDGAPMGLREAHLHDHQMLLRVER